ncbi:dimethylamine monooxygenase subunit DmmA family protein [Derxia gummosa]|uniref:Dimethylamine monooxygenase subunit DmmA family protein n=1 Tax=Derxia gummosa DSM 723 TaxID=1121388 RepID=A0A8B6X2P3_9BURK|nr:dimethylamine monooxygenase subunit DmmA family protein [Derxia gummosa]
MSAPYTIKSQPAWTELGWDTSGRQHLVLAGAADAAVAARLAADAPAGVDLIVIPHDGDEAWLGLASGGGSITRAERPEAALQILRDALAAARMGTRLYLIGGESLIWLAARIANEAGMGESEIHRHRCGTLARPVYCVHCKTITHAIHTNIAPCGGCGRQLFVRDHFSRRLGAYMGFQIDAEEPGVLPDVERIYP